MTNLNFRLIAVLSLLTAGALSARSSIAHAQSGGNAFGAPGEIAITGEFEGHLQKGWELLLRPSLDYFIANNVSIGGVVGIQYDSGGSATTIDLGVRAGYNLNIVNRVSFWPTVGIFYQHHSANEQPSSSSTSLGVFAPFLFHIVPHFFLGAGPFFDLPLDNGGNNYGLRTVVGGWF